MSSYLHFDLPNDASPSGLTAKFLYHSHIPQGCYVQRPVNISLFRYSDNISIQTIRTNFPKTHTFGNVNKSRVFLVHAIKSCKGQGGVEFSCTPTSPLDGDKYRLENILASLGYETRCN